MLKLIKNIRKERYKSPIRCPSCGRILGGVLEVSGHVKVAYICPRCGDVSVELEKE